MPNELTPAQRQRMQTLWNISQTDMEYKQMLLQMRELEKQYDQVIETLEDEARDIVCDYVSLCESMNWRILEIAGQKMVFRFERE